jgi:hypothetical protein
MAITIRENGMFCHMHQLGDFKVQGCQLGNGGVWLSITAQLCKFWMEIHVPMLAVAMIPPMKRGI